MLVPENCEASQDGEEQSCPLCLEEFDGTDKDFLPCACGYQVCLWCLHYIREQSDGKCPACRRAYKESLFQCKSRQDGKGTESGSKPVAATVVTPAGKSTTGEIASAGSDLASNGVRRAQGGEPERSDKALQEIQALAPEKVNALREMRVIQRDLVYVVGLPASIAKKEVLKRKEFLGKYGTILHMVVNKSPHNEKAGGGSSSGLAPSYCAYVTYADENAASEAVKEVSGVMFEGRQLRASFGTTKYCSFFLRGMQCTNHDCFYLHELGPDRDSFTKEEMTSAKHTFNDMTCPFDTRGKKVASFGMGYNPSIASAASDSSSSSNAGPTPPVRTAPSAEGVRVAAISAARRSPPDGPQPKAVLLPGPRTASSRSSTSSWASIAAAGIRSTPKAHPPTPAAGGTRQRSANPTASTAPAGKTFPQSPETTAAGASTAAPEADASSQSQQSATSVQRKPRADQDKAPPGAAAAGPREPSGRSAAGVLPPFPSASLSPRNLTDDDSIFAEPLPPLSFPVSSSSSLRGSRERTFDARSVVMETAAVPPKHPSLLPPLLPLPPGYSPPHLLTSCKSGEKPPFEEGPKVAPLPPEEQGLQGRNGEDGAGGAVPVPSEDRLPISEPPTHPAALTAPRSPQARSAGESVQPSLSVRRGVIPIATVPTDATGRIIPPSSLLETTLSANHVHVPPPPREAPAAPDPREHPDFSKFLARQQQLLTKKAAHAEPLPVLDSVRAAPLPCIAQQPSCSRAPSRTDPEGRAAFAPYDSVDIMPLLADGRRSLVERPAPPPLPPSDFERPVERDMSLEEFLNSLSPTSSVAGISKSRQPLLQAAATAAGYKKDQVDAFVNYWSSLQGEQQYLSSFQTGDAPDCLSPLPCSDDLYSKFPKGSFLKSFSAKANAMRTGRGYGDGRPPPSDGDKLGFTNFDSAGYGFF